MPTFKARSTKVFELKYQYENNKGMKSTVENWKWSY